MIKSGKKIYRFGFGQSPFQIPERVVDTLKLNAHKKEYLPIQGLPELREKISNHLFKNTGVRYSKENILITPGSKEAMLLMHVTFNGEILTPAPSWVSYEPQAARSGAILIPTRCSRRRTHSNTEKRKGPTRAEIFG